MPYAVRVLTRCRNHPVTGITAAMVSMNAVETHCAACSLTVWPLPLRSRLTRCPTRTSDREGAFSHRPVAGSYSSVVAVNPFW